MSSDTPTYLMQRYPDSQPTDACRTFTATVNGAEYAPSITKVGDDAPVAQYTVMFPHGFVVVDTVPSGQK
jgi:hypothetical protein